VLNSQEKMKDQENSLLSCPSQKLEARVSRAQEYTPQPHSSRVEPKTQGSDSRKRHPIYSISALLGDVLEISAISCLFFVSTQVFPDFADIYVGILQDFVPSFVVAAAGGLVSSQRPSTEADRRRARCRTHAGGAQ
jgi:hypothetical protein